MASDALMTLLNRHGYQPIFLPQTGLRPPELYTFVRQPQRRLVRRGPLASYLPADTRARIRKEKRFEPTEGEMAAIEGQQSTGKDTRGAVDFLSKALGCIGIQGAPKVDLSFAGGHSLTFAFTGITYQRVDPADLEEFIGSLRTDAIDQKYIDEGRLHVVYEYIYCRELMIQRSDAARFEHEVTAGNLGNYFDVGTRGKVEIKGGTRISFSGATGQPAAFALKAGRVERDDGGRWCFYPEEAMLGEAVTTETTRPRLIARGVILPVEQADDPHENTDRTIEEV